jgi:glycosyltransferase involved in cell wall biosynthesis
MISVVFATKNGGKIIRRTLLSLANIKTKLKWELLVIDNGSNDNTLDIINEFKSILPLTVFCEAKAGKNNALNSVIHFLNGDVVVFTDDDVSVEEDWLDNINNVTLNHPDFAIFAGNIVPEWEVMPEQWIAEWAPLGHLYAIKGETIEGPCDAGKVWGPNMVVRKGVFEDQDNRFNPDIGPNGSATYAMGSETEFTKRMAKKGFKCWNSKSFTVAHWIPKNSLKEAWIMQRAYRLGKGVTLGKYELEENVGFFKPLFQAVFYTIIKYTIFYLLNPKRRFWIKYKTNYFNGVSRAILRQLSGI